MFFEIESAVVLFGQPVGLAVDQPALAGVVEQSRLLLAHSARSLVPLLTPLESPASSRFALKRESLGGRRGASQRSPLQE